MALRHYAEIFESWQHPDTDTDNQWIADYDLSPYGIPPSAVVEIAISNLSNVAEYYGGVRATSGNIDRRIQIVKSLDTPGDSLVTMHVQADAESKIDYFAQHATHIRFNIVGYWVGCEYVEKIESFDPGSSTAWSGYALDQYGVAGGQVADITASNQHATDTLDMSVRTSGSVRSRLFTLNECEDGGNQCLSVPVKTSGSNAAIEIYSEDIANSTFYLFGYFITPPGTFTETTVIFPEPVSTGSWLPLDVGASGIPYDSVAHFAISHNNLAADIFVGLRETSSSTERILNLTRAEDAGGLTFGSLGVNIDSSGYVSQYASNIATDEPEYICAGYWTDFIEADPSLKHTKSMDLYIFGRNPYIHYIENDTGYDVFETATPSQWGAIDISSKFSSAALAEGVVAEVLICNRSHPNPLWGGIRSVGSSLERKYQIHESFNNYNSHEVVCLHVPVSVDGEIEFYAETASYFDFRVMGAWVGAEYIETTGTFKAGATSGWTQHNLNTYGVPDGKIAEVLISHSGQTIAQSGGVRAVGSSTGRLIDIASLVSNYGAIWEGSTYFTMFVETSGANAAIEVYAGNDDEMDFHVVGYWDQPPGDYIELLEVITPDATTGQWKDLDITAYNVPSDSIVEVAFGNGDWNSENIVGIREYGSILPDRYLMWALTDTDGDAYNGLCGGRWQANVVSGNIQTYHQQTNANSYFAAVGYWEDIYRIPVQTGSLVNLFIVGRESYDDSNDLVMHGHQPFDSSGSYPSGVPFYIYGVQLAIADLFINGLDTHQASGDLFVHGVYGYATNPDDCPAYPSGVSLYMKGFGIIPHSGQCNLFTQGLDSLDASGDLFVHGVTSHIASGDLFIKAPEPAASSLNLVVYNLVDAGPGLLRETNAVFYLKYYHDGLGAAGSIREFVNDQVLYIPNTLFQHSYFIGVSGKTVDHVSDSQLVEPFVPTFGDGTYPHYNDLGGFNYREQMDTDYRSVGGGWQSTKLGYYEDTKYKQNICGTVEDYGYPGSGSMTTVFWMSGAHTSGNVAEVGWFRKNLPEELDIALPSHTLGIRIESESGITVITNVRDVPYEQPSGGGLWWGGTTHYGTPSGSTWEWNTEVTELYRTWEEEWPTAYIAHDPITFVALHADFIASGIDGSHPNHMKVYLSLDGQPWTYIGSGLTGPPASSLYSYSEPTNQRAENSVGVRQQGINVSGGIIPLQMGGVKQGSIVLSENVLWTDAGRFTTDELRDLHSIVDTYNRPLDEYRPTIVPPSTYIQRTVGTFAYDPTIPGIGYNPGEICSGLRVTIEVGLGAYGADASAYLLEETPPSGFYISNIQPTTISPYHGQGTRPNGGQQIFHDPQSGIMQPYNDELNLNSYGASIRWVNHDNHPEINRRRSPTPTGIYTYDMFPLHYHGVPRVDDFAFAGSGVFFGGSTGSGTFVVETTGDTTGTTSGLTGGLVSRGCNLYIQGPLQNSGTANLYIRTQESFTSAYIGTSPRTPESTDFIFAADGAAAIESMAGIEYGPPLYTRGPLQYEDSCDLVIFGPAANNVDFYMQGHVHVDTSGDYPSGVLLRIGDGHEPSVASGDLYIQGPTPWSSGTDLYTMAGAFTSVDGGAGHGPSPPLYTLAHDGSSGNCNLFIKGPEFICSSGSFSYPGNPDDFTHPYGDLSPPLYMYGYDQASGTCPLFIGPGRQWGGWTLYLQTDDNDENKTLNLFIHGFTPASGSSGVNQTFNNVGFYLEAADADYPYTAGGTEAWTLFMKAQTGNLTSDEAWTLFLKADFTVPATCSMYMYGHAPGEPPRGNEISGSVGLVCSVNPDDPTRIGFLPYDAHDDPWNLFLKCEPGWFGTATLYMSGAVPELYAASGNLFVRGLFEQETSTAPLYLMGVSGMFNNGPSGLHLFLDAGTLVYNTSGNLYVHGY